MTQLDKLIDSYRDDMIRDAQSLVRIKSVQAPPVGDFPFGEGVQKSLEKALEIAKKLGFRTDNIDNYAGEAEFGQGNESIGLLGHLDVVPEGNGWTYPPYSAELHDGFIYGRGIADNKGPTIIGLYAMKAVMESGLPLSKRVRMIFGTNEESGMLGVQYYVNKKGAPTMSFVPDAMFPLVHGEKGIMSFKFKTDAPAILKQGTTLLSGTGGNAVNSVPDICKVVLKTDDGEILTNILLTSSEKEDYSVTWEQKNDLFEIVTHGISAHGSMPQIGKNAVTYMFSILGQFAPAEASPIAAFIHLYNAKIAFEHYGNGIGCGLEDKESGKLAFNPGLFALTKQGIEVSVNIRYPVTHTVEEVYAGMEKEVKGTCVYIEPLSNSNPLYFPLDHPLVDTLMRVYIEKTGEKDAKPMTMGGGTYARKLPNAVAFGPGFPWSQGNAHKPDEKGSIDDMLLAAKVYAKAIYELAK